MAWQAGIEKKGGFHYLAAAAAGCQGVGNTLAMSVFI